MHFGIFVGLGFLGNLLTFLVFAILFFIGIYVAFFTQFGLLIIGALIIYGLYRLFSYKSPYV